MAQGELAPAPAFRVVFWNIDLRAAGTTRGSRKSRRFGPTFAPWVAEVPRRTAQSTLLITVCAGRSPAAWIDPARALASAERKGHTQANPRDLQSCSDPIDLDTWLSVPRHSESPALTIFWFSFGPSARLGQLLVPPGNQPLGELGV